MRHCFVFLAAISVAVTPLCSALGNEAAARDANAFGQPRVVKLYGAGGLGGLAPYQTGVVVSSDGLIATIDTLVLEGGEATAVLLDGSRRAARVVGADPTSSIALLRMEPPLRGAPFVDFHAGRRAEIGQEVFALANAFGIAAGDEPVSLLAGVTAAELPPTTNGEESQRAFLLDSVTGSAGVPGGLVLAADRAPLGLLAREVVNDVTGLQVNPVLPAAHVAERIEALLAGPVDNQIARSPDSGRVSTLDLFGFAMIPDLVPRTPPYIDYIRPMSSADRVALAPGDLIVAIGERVTASQRDVFAAVREEGEALQLTVQRDGRLIEVSIEAEEGAP